MTSINLYHLKLYKTTYSYTGIGRFCTTIYNDKYFYRFHIQHKTLSKISKNFYYRYYPTGRLFKYLRKNFKYIYDNY